MPTYISLLRGINVGGARKLRIEELKKLYESLGFEKVRTYIQTGNLVFEFHSDDAGALGRIIEGKIREAFGLEVTVLLRTREELGQIVRRNPFLKTNTGETGSFHVTFLSDSPDHKAMGAFNFANTGRDRFKIVGREVFLYCPDGYGRTKLTNNAFESKLRVKATTRNWATVNRLLELAAE